MPKIDKEIQKSLWKMGDALAKALKTPAPGEEGDPRWRVEGVANRVWSINHPELPLVRDEEGDEKDVLLQLHITTEEETGNWLVIVQNKVVGPESNSSPKALVVAKEETPPGEDWDVESIARAAANFFHQQKSDLMERAQAETPSIPPGSMDTGAVPPTPAPMPIASRRNRVSKAIKAKRPFYQLKMPEVIEKAISLGLAKAKTNDEAYGIVYSAMDQLLNEKLEIYNEVGETDPSAMTQYVDDRWYVDSTDGPAHPVEVPKKRRRPSKKKSPRSF